MTDLNVALILRMIDQFSGPADKVRAAIRGMGNSAKEFRQGFAAQIRAGFSEANIADALAKNEQAVNKARGRLMGAFGMGLTLAAPVMASGKMQADLIDYGNLAGLTAEKLRALGVDLSALSRVSKTGMSAPELLAGLQTYVGKGLDQDAALKALLATGRAAKATNSEFNDMAAAGFAVMDNLTVAPEQLRRVFDAMAKSGKEGSFELKDMARNFPEITAGARALGMEGVDGVASLAAALQVAMKSAGSADQAANNFSNFMGKLTSPDTVKKFAEFGVDVQAELNKAAASGADPLEHMLAVIQKVTGGDQFKMGELFADKQVLDFLRAAIPNLEEYRRIKQAALGADGIIDADYDAKMGGFIESTTQLKNAVMELFGASGVLLPILTDITKQATAFVYAVSDWTKAHPKLTEAIVKGGAALLAFGIGSRVLGYGFAIMRGGLIRTLGLFLKFNDAGRNVSIAAKAVRGLGWAIGGIGKLAKFDLLLSALDGLAFRFRSTAAVAESSMAAAEAATVARGATIIPLLAKLARGAGITTAVAIGLSPMPLNTGRHGETEDQMLAQSSKQYDALTPAEQQALTDAETARANAGIKSTPLASGTARMAGLLEDAEDLKQYIGKIQADIDNIGVGPMTDALAAPLREQLQSQKDDLAAVEAEIAKIQQAAKIGATAIGGLDGMKATPTIDTTALDKALDKIAVLKGVISPEAMRAAAAQMRTPQIETRSGSTDPATSRMATPPAAAPVQKIEETINHDYRSEHSITVTVPVQITQQVAADAARISRDVGARVEAATRRALSDHGGPQ